MSTAAPPLATHVSLGDLRVARLTLLAAQLAKSEKDSPAHRDAVVQAVERMNDLLDRKLALGNAR